jgi:hypothetical protein
MHGVTRVGLVGTVKLISSRLRRSVTIQSLSLSVGSRYSVVSLVAFAYQACPDGAWSGEGKRSGSEREFMAHSCIVMLFSSARLLFFPFQRLHLLFRARVEGLDRNSMYCMTAYSPSDLMSAGFGQPVQVPPYSRHSNYPQRRPSNQYHLSRHHTLSIPQSQCSVVSDKIRPVLRRLLYQRSIRCNFSRNKPPQSHDRTSTAQLKHLLYYRQVRRLFAGRA